MMPQPTLHSCSFISTLQIIPVCFSRYLRKLFTEDIARGLHGSAKALIELEEEWKQLEEDRRILRTIFPTGDNKVRFHPDLSVGRINALQVTDLLCRLSYLVT